MTRTEKLALLSEVAAQLDEAALDDFLAAAQHATSPTSFYATAPQHVRDSVDRGVADSQAGRVSSLQSVMNAIALKFKAPSV
jgi:predicted transcriptional regulator